MTTPLFCLFLAALLIYLPRGFVVAGQAQREEGYDNANPRDQQARLEGKARRAQAAHMNAFEAFMIFLGGVLVVQTTVPGSALAGTLCITFILARVIYTFAYIYDRPNLRSAIWVLATLSALALYLIPLF